MTMYYCFLDLTATLTQTNPCGFQDMVSGTCHLRVKEVEAELVAVLLLGRRTLTVGLLCRGHLLPLPAAGTTECSWEGSTSAHSGQELRCLEAPESV